MYVCELFESNLIIITPFLLIASNEFLIIFSITQSNKSLLIKALIYCLDGLNSITTFEDALLHVSNRICNQRN